MRIYYTEKEQKELLKSIVILIDTREQKNKHITDFFKGKNKKYKNHRLIVGDYSFMIPANEEFDIKKDIFFDNEFCIERKNGIDELANNFGKERTQFENEMLRAKELKRFSLIIEQETGYYDIINWNYRSQLNNSSFLGTLHSLSTSHNFNFIFIRPENTGGYILGQFYYYMRNYLLNKLY